MCVTHLEQWLTHSKCSLSVSYHYFYPPKLWLRFYILLVPKEGRSCLYCLPLKFNVKVLRTPNCCHPWFSPHPLPQPTSPPWAHTSPVKASSLPSVSFSPPGYSMNVTSHSPKALTHITVMTDNISTAQETLASARLGDTSKSPYIWEKDKGAVCFEIQHVLNKMRCFHVFVYPDTNCWLSCLLQAGWRPPPDRIPKRLRQLQRFLFPWRWSFMGG